jgi:DNA-binding transcriptional regulator YiaG
MTCISCGAAQVSRRLGTHRYVGVGIPDVHLVNVEIRRCRRCGSREIVLPRLAELHALIARALVERPGDLHAGTIRLLRTWLGLSRDDFARAVGVSRVTAYRWERRGDAHAMLRAADNQMRLLVTNRAPGDRPTRVTPELEGVRVRRRLTFKAPSWQRVNALHAFDE